MREERPQGLLKTARWRNQGGDGTEAREQSRGWPSSGKEKNKQMKTDKRTSRETNDGILVTRESMVANTLRHVKSY